MSDKIINHSADIGVESLVYAKLTNETATTNSYEDVKEMSPAINIKVNPKSNSETLYADNRPCETATTLGEIDVEIEAQDLPLVVQGDILGHTFDAATGGLSYNANDQAPYVATGFKVKKNNGKYKYVWLYKGKYQEVETENATGEDKPKFQTGKIKATFVSRVDGQWKYVVDEDAATVGIPTDFLKTVYEPNSLLSAPTLTSDSTANNPNSAIDINFTDDASWRGNISAVYVNGSEVSIANVTLASGKITIAGSVFPTVGSYTIVVVANGYKSASVNQTIVSA